MGGWSLSFIGGDVYDSRYSSIIFNIISNLQNHKKITAPVKSYGYLI